MFIDNSLNFDNILNIFSIENQESSLSGITKHQTVSYPSPIPYQDIIAGDETAPSISELNLLLDKFLLETTSSKSLYSGPLQPALNAVATAFEQQSIGSPVTMIKEEWHRIKKVLKNAEGNINRSFKRLAVFKASVDNLKINFSVKDEHKLNYVPPYAVCKATMQMWIRDLIWNIPTLKLNPRLEIELRCIIEEDKKNNSFLRGGFISQSDWRALKKVFKEAENEKNEVKFKRNYKRKNIIYAAIGAKEQIKGRAPSREVIRKNFAIWEDKLERTLPFLRIDPDLKRALNHKLGKRSKWKQLSKMQDLKSRQLIDRCKRSRDTENLEEAKPTFIGRKRRKVSPIIKQDVSIRTELRSGTSIPQIGHSQKEILQSQNDLSLLQDLFGYKRVSDNRQPKSQVDRTSLRFILECLESNHS